MTIEEIDGVVESFAIAATRVKDAGFHGPQRHGTHGYLISQFRSKEILRRKDDYGGSLEIARSFLTSPTCTGER